MYLSLISRTHKWLTSAHHEYTYSCCFHQSAYFTQNTIYYKLQYSCVITQTIELGLSYLFRYIDYLNLGTSCRLNLFYVMAYTSQW